MNDGRTDFELLRDFIRRGDQQAFAETVRRHLDLVLSREGSGKYGQMGESGVIDLKHFPPLFRNIFPGGWKEVAAREGFPLPVNEVEP